MKKEEKDLASLMDELLEVLSEERDIYEELAPISEKKTQVLIKEDLKELKKITDKEQLLVDKVSIVDRKREKVIQNISVVLNKDSKELDLATLGNILCKQPDERKKLNMLHDSLRQVMNRLVIANQKNKELIQGCRREITIIIAMPLQATQIQAEADLMQNSSSYGVYS